MILVYNHNEKNNIFRVRIESTAQNLGKTVTQPAVKLIRHILRILV